MVVADNLHIVYRVYGAGGDRGTAATALLRILGRKTRGSIREVHAIRGMSFVAYRGDAVGVIGRNGSGKSTLLRAVAGLLPAEQGNIYTTGEASLLGVNAALMDDLTGERNVILGCLAMGMTRQEARDKYQEIVDFSGVGEFIDLPMRTYSSGMGARLRFAIAAAKSHDVLLVDEALATGDAEFRVKSHARIQELREQAGTVFLVAHNLEEVEETCNRVIWMERGRMVMEGDDVTGIIDQYIEASGGQPVMRDPETGHRLGGRQHAARNQLAADPKDEATTKSGPAATAAGDEPAAKKKPAAKNEPSAKNGPAAKNGPTARNGSAARNQPAGRARK
jgi:teichoic acid transport system ATP-binding protein